MSNIQVEKKIKKNQNTMALGKVSMRCHWETDHVCLGKIPLTNVAIIINWYGNERDARTRN